MRPPLLLRFTSALALLLSVTSIGQASVQDRISSTTGGRVPLPHMVPAKARVSADLGPVSPDLKLSSVTVRFNMTEAQQSALTRLLSDQQNSNSPRYHHWLTPEQFGQQFGLSDADLAKVTAWLTSQGLTVSATSRSRTFVTVSGSAAQVEQAFHTTLHNLTWNGEKHFANVSDPALPAQIAGVIGGIAGLNDYKLKSRSRVQVVREVVMPKFTSSISGNHYVAPGDFDTIYDVNPLLTSSITGAGVQIAVMGQTDISLTDVAAFRSASGLPANVPSVVLASGSNDPGTNSNDIDEAQLDVEWAGAIATNAKVLYVNSTDVLGSSLQYAIDSNVAPIISISYGDCEANFGQSTLNTYNLLLAQANTQGQTVVAPGGDSGATDCDYQTATATQGLAVDFPASSPYATGAGGTMFNDGTATGGTSYWASTNAANNSSATGYIPEVVWNEDSGNISTSGGTLGAGGGGPSDFFTKPYWQVGSGVPNDSARDVPDIALNSAASHDGYLFCSQGSCVTGFRGSDGQSLDVVGGTSVATPAFASVLALVSQQTAKARLGNVNPVLYALANSTFRANVYHDIVSGDNKSPCTAGSVDCPSGGSIGFSAGPGYDLTTGWGSIDAYNLATKWSQVSPSGNTSLPGTTVSATTLTSTSPVCGVPAAKLALSINVASASGGGGTPGGTIQLLLDGTAIGAPLILSNGNASYTLDTSAYTSGAHTVAAVYSGDNTFAGSRSALTEDVVSGTKPDFTFTPCTAAITVASGNTSSGTTFTLTSVNGFNGSVNMTATSNDATLAAAYVFSVTPVALSSGSSATTVFTLQAYQKNAKTGHGLIKLAPSQTSSSRSPWYIAGSGATLACLMLFIAPRRRRWGALLAILCTAGVLGAAGCGGNTMLVTNSGGGTTPTQTNATAGTYNILLSGTSGSIVHSTNLTVTIQ